MADPGAFSASIAQLTTTSGIGTYTLGMPIRDKLPISAAYVDGEPIRYQVTDTSGTQEVCDGTFALASNTLTRDTLVMSSTGSFIDWPLTGQRVVTPLLRFPICDDVVPQIGDSLVWNGIDYCPALPVVGGNVFYISFSYGSTFQTLPSDPFDSNLEIFDMVAPTAITFPTNLNTSPTPICEVAPTTDIQLNIESYIGAVRTQRGTLTYTTGSTTGTYTLAAFTLAAGGRLRLYLDPIGDDGVIAGIAGTIVGTR